MPRLKSWQTEIGIHYKPQEILDYPEQHDTAENARLDSPVESTAYHQRQMEDECHKGEDPEMVTGHGFAAPENVEQGIVLDPPCRQRRRPAVRPLNLDFNLSKEEAE